MFSWFSKATPAAASAPETCSATTSSASSTSTSASSSRTAVPKARSNSTTALSPPRAIPGRKGSAPSGLCGSVYDDWSCAANITAAAPAATTTTTTTSSATVPPAMSRTGSFSSTDSTWSSDSMISATEHVNDPTFSYAYGYVEPRIASAFIADDELRFDGADDSAFRAARLSAAYNSDSDRNTLYRPQKIAPAPVRMPRRAGRVRMNAINEE